MIWKVTLPEPRHVNLATPAPIVLQINQESREVALNCYSPLTSAPGIFVDFAIGAIDVSIIDTGVLGKGFKISDLDLAKV